MIWYLPELTSPHLQNPTSPRADVSGPVATVRTSAVPPECTRQAAALHPGPHSRAVAQHRLQYHISGADRSAALANGDNRIHVLRHEACRLKSAALTTSVPGVSRVESGGRTERRLRAAATRAGDGRWGGAAR